MDNIHKAIELAAEGGYPLWNPHGVELRPPNYPHTDRELFLDPLFWQSLGKAEKWVGEEIRLCVGCGKALRWNETECNCGDQCIEHYPGQWLIEWHKFIDHLADGKPADDFFRDLLANHKTS